MNYSGNIDWSALHDGPTKGADVGIDSSPHRASSDTIVIPNAHLLFSGDYDRSGLDLILSKDGQNYVVHDYFKGEKRASLSSPDGAQLSGHIVETLAGHTQYAQADGSTSVAKVIGHVAKLTGNATAIRNGVAVELHVGDNVNKGDVVQAGADSSLNLTFIDGTVFGLTSNARMVLNEMIYDPNGSANSSLLSLVQGTITFVAGETAKHGDMRVDTPVATMGIRGTAVLVEIDFTVPGQGGAPPVNFSVLVEPGGRTGSYELFSKSDPTVVIGTVNQAGQVTSVTGSGDTSTSPAGPLSPLAQAIIQQTFQEYFPNYVPNPNPRSNSPGGSSAPPSPLDGNIDKLPNLIIDQPNLVPINLRGDTPNSPTTTYDVIITPHNSPPTVVVTPVVVTFPVNKTSFNIGDQVQVTDPDPTDVILNYVPGSAQSISAIGPTNTPSNINLSQLITIDPQTGAVSYNPADFAFLPQGTQAIYTIAFDSKSGPDTIHKTLTVTIDGANDAPVVAAPLTMTVQQGSNASVSVDLLAGATDPDLGETSTLKLTNVTYKVGAGAETVSAPTGVTLNGTTLSVDPTNTAFKHLAANETLTILVSYDVTDVHGAIVHQTETVVVTGTYDAPTVTGAVTGTATEDGAISRLDALANVHVIDDGATLSVTNLPEQLPAGVSYEAETHTFTLNPFDAAYQHLAAGQTATVSVSYGVFDGTTTIATSVSWTVTGTYDAPTVSGEVTGNATEDGALSKLDALANVHVIDDGASLSVTNLPDHLPAGVSYDPASHTFTLNPTNAAYQYLAAGQTATVSVSYGIFDGTTTIATSVSWTVTGVNDAPVIAQGTVATKTVSVAPSALTAVGAALLAAPGNVLARDLGGTTGFGTQALGAGDDNSSGPIDITSVFGSAGVNFFGHNYTSIYINNNGNISFNSPNGTYTPSAINGGAGNPIIAAFWADVDTRNGAGHVYYDLDPIDGVMTITWDQVGYYSGHSDKLNSFQIILINEGGGNFDIVYKYADIQWTTGDASRGSGGLGGTAARAGYSAGDGVHYYELPQSGNQAALLLLDNPGTPAVEFQVHNGDVGSSAVTASGVIDFSDPDATDTHTASIAQGSHIGLLTLTKMKDSAGLGQDGEFGWSYAADAAAVKAALLHSDRGSVIDTFDVIIDDGHGGTVHQTVSVTLNASNADVLTKASGSWTNGGDWSLGHAPLSAEVAYIDGAKHVGLDVSLNHSSIAGLHIAAGADVDLTESGAAGSLVISGELTNLGTIRVGSHTTLKVLDVTTGHGHASLNGGTLEFVGASDANVQFQGAGAETLVLDNPSAFTGTISGMSTGDTIKLGNLAPTNAKFGAGTVEFDFSSGSTHALIVANYTAADNNSTHTLKGTSGNDIFIGGAGADNFVFAPVSGNDVITNFQHGDHLDVSAFVAENNLTQWITDHVHTAGADTLIAIDANNSITLHNVLANSLSTSDFIVNPHA